MYSLSKSQIPDSIDRIHVIGKAKAIINYAPRHYILEPGFEVLNSDA